tara:strand:- start:472 stop:1347 length:876 start_codon:yes stop_codon:yes gene_type:complete
MAENINTTISRPAPYLEAAGETLLDLTTGLTGQPIDTSQFAPSVAGQNVLTQQAQQQAATQGGLGTLQFNQQGAISGVGTGTGIAGYQPYLDQAQQYIGPTAYQDFMSPYQTDVIDATLSEFDKQRQIAQQQISDNAINAGAFGGGREGVQQAEFSSQSLRDRSLLQAQMLQQGFGQAQVAAGQAQTQSAGLASLQPSLAQSNIQQLGAAGTTDLGYQQAVLDAQSAASREAAYEPYQRTSYLGSTVGGLLSGYPQSYMQTSQAPAGASASPLSQALGGASTVYGLGSLFS